MQTIEVNGTFSFINNIKKLKINDPIKLIRNKNNRITSDAIGAYTMQGDKIGYIPFKEGQIDINNKYWIHKISLTKQNPILLLGYNIIQSNIISVPKYIINNKITIPNEYKYDITHFKKYLEMKGHTINNIGILYHDINFIVIYIDGTIYHTVTKKYYEENIFKYDEFYNIGLIPYNIYNIFQIHRLDCYITLNYKPLDKMIKNLLKNKKLREIPKGVVIDYSLNELKEGGLCWNHMYSSYCYIEKYNSDVIYDSSSDINNNYINTIYCKLLISCKNTILIYSKIKKNIIKINISDIIYD